MASNHTSHTVNCTWINHEKIICNGTIFQLPEQPLSYKDTQFWIYLGIYVFLVLFAGLVSGLTMGLLSLDVLNLKVLERGGRPSEQKCARRILPLVKKHHLLLVTLLIASSGSMEAMPIFMDRISNPIVAVFVSVASVLIVAEIIPQALCTRFGLKIGATMAPLVWFLIAVLFVIAWPIAKLLDCLLGEGHSTFFRRAELKELVGLHKDDNIEDPLKDEEVLIIQGALDMRNKKVKDSYTPLDKVFMLSVDERLNDELMKKIYVTGHSRIPVYRQDRQNVVGLLLVKSMIRLNPDDAVPVESVLRPREWSLLSVESDEPLFELLDKFLSGKSNMSLVYESSEKSIKRLLGIITLEDVIEQLIQEDIWDETDPKVIRPGVEGKVTLARAKISRKKSGSGPSTYPTLVRAVSEQNHSTHPVVPEAAIVIPEGLASDEKTPLLG